MESIRVFFLDLTWVLSVESWDLSLGFLTASVCSRVPLLCSLILPPASKKNWSKRKWKKSAQLIWWRNFYWTQYWNFWKLKNLLLEFIVLVDQDCLLVCLFFSSKGCCYLSLWSSSFRSNYLWISGLWICFSCYLIIWRERRALKNLVEWIITWKYEKRLEFSLLTLVALCYFCWLKRIVIIRFLYGVI